MARLGDLCDILNGYAFKSEQYVDSGIRIIRIANVQKGYIEDSTPVFYPVNNNEYKKYELYEGDLLISLTGNVGRVALLQKEFLPAALNQRVACLRIKDESVLNKSFLFSMLDSDYFENKCIESSKGVAQKNMSTEWLKEYDIHLFSMEEQLRISNELDTINNLISLRKQQLAKLDELVKSRFIEMFGNVRDNEKNWEKVSLKSVAEVRGRVGWKGYKKDDLRESGPLVLGATHLTESGCLDLSSPVHLSREKYEESPEIMLQKNDLIFTQRGNTIGKVGLLENDIGEATINPCVLILRPLTINPIYFKTYFILDETKSDMWSLNAGSAQPMITQKGIGDYMLMLPPMEVQKQFAAFVEQTDKSKFEIQQSLEKLETLKKALMQKYFG